jgi:hypothetical protein
MRRAVLVLAAAASMAGGIALADTKDLEKVKSQIEECITELEKADAAHHDELGGHGSQAKSLLNQAAKEVHAAIETANAAGKKPAGNKAPTPK